MKRQTSIEVGVFALLAVAGIAARLYFQFLPNFAPVAALALFAGYFFRSRWAAVALPLCVLAATDLLIGGYEPLMMAVVYAALALPVVFGGLLRRRVHLRRGDGQPSAWRSVGSTVALVSCSLAASVFFFLATNFGHWAIVDMYEKTAAGLVQCFTAALPFFRYTLMGDLTFAAALFGGYAAITSVAEAKARVMEEAAA